MIIGWSTTELYKSTSSSLSLLYYNPTASDVDSSPTNAAAATTSSSAVNTTFSVSSVSQQSSWQKEQQNEKSPSNQDSSKDDSLFTICLLTKDDNDILSEWLAYHYHTMKLRHIVVATDPTSLTSPRSILERYATTQFSFSILKQRQQQQRNEGEDNNNMDDVSFTYDLWNDTDYMPTWFTNTYSEKHHDYSRDDYEQYQVPKFVPTHWFHNSSTSPFHKDLDDASNIPHQKLLQDYMKINNHWYRQRVFLNQCIRHIYNTYIVDVDKNRRYYKHVYMAHIDTDEYITINQHVLDRFISSSSTTTTKKVKSNANENNEAARKEDDKETDAAAATQPPKTNLQAIVPYEIGATSNSIINFYDTMRKYHSKRLNLKCQSMPTILYGSLEDEDDNSKYSHRSLDKKYSFNWKNFETTRWHYHANWRDYRNGFQKVLMDLALYESGDNDMIFTTEYAYNPHQPSNQSCNRMTLFPEVTAVKKYPLTLNHYIGSFERYISRSQDSRRNRKVYDLKSNFTLQDGKDGSIHDSNGWITTWIVHFVNEYGIDAVKYLLGERYFLLG